MIYNNSIQTQLDQSIHDQQCRQFCSYAAEFFSNYQEYSIAYDISHNNISQIQDDINRNKITLKRVNEIYQAAQIFIDELEFDINSLTA